MNFSWEEIKAKKGRKIERLIFDIEVKDPEQVEMDFSTPSVDMSKHKTLQKNLREICGFSDSNVKKVLRHLEEYIDDKQVFQQLDHKTEIRIMDGKNGNAQPVNNPEAWALNLFDKTISNFNALGPFPCIKNAAIGFLGMPLTLFEAFVVYLSNMIQVLVRLLLVEKFARNKLLLG